MPEIKSIKNVIEILVDMENALESVKVSGHADCSVMAGSYSAIEHIIRYLKSMEGGVGDGN